MSVPHSRSTIFFFIHLVICIWPKCEWRRFLFENTMASILLISKHNFSQQKFTLLMTNNDSFPPTCCDVWWIIHYLDWGLAIAEATNSYTVSLLKSVQTLSKQGMLLWCRYYSVKSFPLQSGELSRKLSGHVSILFPLTKSHQWEQTPPGALNQDQLDPICCKLHQCHCACDHDHILAIYIKNNRKEWKKEGPQNRTRWSTIWQSGRVAPTQTFLSAK